MPAPVESVEPICAECRDSGWQPFVCHGLDCGRRKVHLAHEYVRPCPCRPLNRNYQERIANQRRRAA